MSGSSSGGVDIRQVGSGDSSTSLPKSPALGRLVNNWADWSQAIGWASNPSKIPDSVIVAMMNDDVIYTVINLVKRFVVARIGGYSHEDTEISEFVNDNLAMIRGRIGGVFKRFLDGVGYGCAVGELVFVNGEGKHAGKWVLKEVVDLKFGSYKFRIDMDKSSPNYGQVDKVIFRPGTTNQIELDLSKVAIYTHNESAGNPYGESILKPIYPIYYRRGVVANAWPRALERFAGPMAIGYMKGVDSKVLDKNGQESTRGEELVKLLDNLPDNSSMVVEKDVTEIQVVTPTKGISQDFQAYMDFSMRAMMRIAAIPALILDNSNTGSRALGDSQSDVMNTAMDDLAEDLCDMMLDQVIKKMIYYNFGPQDSWGEFTISEVKPEELKSLMEVITGLLQGKILGGPTDEKKIREMFGFEERDEKERKEAMGGGVSNDPSQQNGPQQGQGQGNPPPPSSPPSNQSPPPQPTKRLFSDRARAIIAEAIGAEG